MTRVVAAFRRDSRRRLTYAPALKYGQCTDGWMVGRYGLAETEHPANYGQATVCLSHGANELGVKRRGGRPCSVIGNDGAVPEHALAFDSCGTDQRGIWCRQPKHCNGRPSSYEGTAEDSPPRNAAESSKCSMREVLVMVNNNDISIGLLFFRGIGSNVICEATPISPAAWHTLTPAGLYPGPILSTD